MIATMNLIRSSSAVASSKKSRGDISPFLSTVACRRLWSGRKRKEVGLSAEELALRGESAAFAIGQPKTSAAELSFEDAILLGQVVDDVLLVAV